MSNTEVIKELKKIIHGNTCSWNQMSVMEHAIKLLSPTPSKELIHEYFDNCSTRPASIESKELKSAEQIITEQIGIRLDAPKQTPMDKGECIVCMEAYASQLHPSPTHDVEDGKQGGEVSVEDVLADIISIRNKLYEDLPTGEMNAFELLQTIKWHINELDNYCTTLSTYKSQPVNKQD